MEKQSIVMVTGATGYLGSHIILQLLQKGYKVKGTVRSLTDKYIQSLYLLHPNAKDNLQLCKANLMNQSDWNNALKNVDYLMHVASPCSIDENQKPEDIIIPAVNGVKYVLEAAIENQVKKVVLTSSTTTVAYGTDNETEGLIYNEDNWGTDDLKSQKRIYNISKIRAEKTAWKIYEQNKDKIKLTTIVPGIFLGPILINKNSPSIDFFQMFFKGNNMASLSFEYCDVRDVAKAHILAIEKEDETNGKRYIIAENSYWMTDIMKILKKNYQYSDYNFKTNTIPNWLYGIASWFSNTAYVWQYRLNKRYILDNTRSKQELGLQYIDFEKTIIDCTNDCIKYGFIENKLHKTLDEQQIIQILIKIQKKNNY